MVETDNCHDSICRMTVEAISSDNRFPKFYQLVNSFGNASTITDFVHVSRGGLNSMKFLKSKLYSSGAKTDDLR